MPSTTFSFLKMIPSGTYQKGQENLRMHKYIYNYHTISDMLDMCLRTTSEKV